MILHLVRHGETESNKTGKFISYTDEPLTVKGIRKTERFAKSYSLRPRMIFSSPMKRCKDTSKMIARTTGSEIIYDERLLEVNFGIFEGFTRVEILERFKKTYDERRADKLNYQIPKGESYSEGIKRINSFVREIYEKFPEDEILVVTHATLIKLFLYEFLKKDLDYWENIYYENLCGYRIDIKSKPGGIN